MVFGGLVGFGLSALAGPSYATSMQFFVSTAGSGTTSDAFQGGQFAQQRVASYTGFLTGNELAARVVRELGSDITAAEVAESIDATTVPGTVLIDVTVTSSSAARADEIAAALSQAFPALVADLESGGDEADAPVNVELTDRPDVAVEPSPPLAVENTLVGVLLGLVLGGAAAIARVLLDRTVTDQELAEDIAGAPVTGVVFHDDALHAGHTLDGVAPRTAEQYRQLATSLQYLNVDAPPTVIMVSSSVPSEGKTTMVVNLALALAEAGHRVTVVEADLRRPKVTEYLGLVSGAGVTNVLTGTADVEDVVQLVGEGQLRVIAAGPTPPNPSRLLGSSQMAALLAKLRSDNDYVLVDAAPLLPVADSRALAASVDGVLLSIRHGSTTKDQLREAVAALGGVGATTLGVVLNLVPLRSDLAAAHAYGLEYGYAANRTTQLDPTAELVPEASLAGPRQAPGTERPGAPPRAGAPVLQRQDK